MDEPSVHRSFLFSAMLRLEGIKRLGTLDGDGDARPTRQTTCNCGTLNVLLSTARHNVKSCGLAGGGAGWRSSVEVNVRNSRRVSVVAGRLHARKLEHAMYQKGAARLEESQERKPFSLKFCTLVVGESVHCSHVALSGWAPLGATATATEASLCGDVRLLWLWAADHGGPLDHLANRPPKRKGGGRDVHSTSD